MAADSITAYEDALIARCLAALTLGGKRLVRAVESLPGDWDDEMLKRLLRAVPGVFVAFAGGPVNPAATAEIQATWVIYVVTGHASGEAARRRGDALEVGAYGIACLLATALHEWSPNAVDATLKLTELSNLYTGTIDKQGVAVYALTFQVPMAFGPLVPADLADFLVFNANLDMPQHAPEPIQRMWMEKNDLLGGPDARDQVDLPQG